MISSDRASDVGANLPGVASYRLARTVTKNSVAELIGTFVAMGSSFLAVPLLARHLGNIDYGKYSTAIAFTTLFVSASDLGLGNISTRDVASDKSKASKYLGNLLIMRGILAIVLPLVVCGLALVLPYSTDTKIAIYVLAFGSSLAGLSRAYTWLFQAFQKLEYDALFTILGSVLNLGVVIGIIVMNGSFITLTIGVSSLNVVVLVIGLLVVVTRFVRPKFELDWKLSQYLLEESLPLAATWAFATIYVWIGVPLLSLLSGDAATGWYSGANKLAGVLRMLPAFFMAAVFPVMAQLYSSPGRFAQFAERSFELVLAIGLALTVGITVLSKSIVLFVLGPGFLQSSTVLIALAWAFLFVCVSQVGGAVLIIAGKQKVNALATGLGLVVHLLLDFLLIPLYAQFGLALSVLVTEGIVAFVVIFYLNGAKIFLLRPGRVIGVVMAGFAMGSGMYVLRPLSVLLAAPIGVMIFGAVLILANVISIRDLSLFSEVLLRRERSGGVENVE